MSGVLIRTVLIKKANSIGVYYGGAAYWNKGAKSNHYGGMKSILNCMLYHM